MKCLRCGACCRHFIVEATIGDVRREPRIDRECQILDGHGTILRQQASWSIACGKTSPCPFLRSDNRCDIHKTKPRECRQFRPGEALCAEARQAERARKVLLAGKGKA